MHIPCLGIITRVLSLQDVKLSFHFNRIVEIRSVFYCFVNTQTKQMIWSQHRMRYVSLEVEKSLKY